MWQYGSFLLPLNKGFLIKYNVEQPQRDIVLDIVGWFPNFWVRKLFVAREKWTN